MTTPNGWKLVPVKLTEDMANEMECSWGTEEQWERALAAAPSPPSVTREEIARIMEPMFDRLYDYNITYPSHSKTAWLEKADAVLALFQRAPASIPSGDTFNAGVQAAWECATAMANSLPMEPITHGAKVMRDAAMDIADAILELKNADTAALFHQRGEKG